MPLQDQHWAAEALADALVAATTDATMRRRADVLGARIRAKGGIGDAVHHIETAITRARWL